MAQEIIPESITVRKVNILAYMFAGATTQAKNSFIFILLSQFYTSISLGINVINNINLSSERSFPYGNYISETAQDQQGRQHCKVPERPL